MEVQQIVCLKGIYVMPFLPFVIIVAFEFVTFLYFTFFRVFLSGAKWWPKDQFNTITKKHFVKHVNKKSKFFRSSGITNYRNENLCSKSYAPVFDALRSATSLIGLFILRAKAVVTFVTTAIIIACKSLQH